MPSGFAGDRLVAVALVALVVLSASGAAVGAVATPGDNGDYEVAEGREGHIDPGREDDEQQAFPINLTFVPLSRQPGATNTGYNLYASGNAENGSLHWTVLHSRAFDASNCASTDTRAFGLDKGNDDPGTEYEVNLLQAYKSYTSNATGIYIEFYKEEGIAGGPINGTIYDQIVASQDGCLTNPAEAGWYRVDGLIKGSTKFDTTTDATVYATSQYFYICDCADEQAARQQLGPPPDEQSTATSTATATPGGPDTATATGTSTPASTADGDADTPTPAERSGDGAETEAAGTAGDDSGGTTRTAAAATAGPGQTSEQPGGARSSPTRSPTTPTLAAGPGFGLLLVGVALAVLLAVAGREY